MYVHVPLCLVYIQSLIKIVDEKMQKLSTFRGNKTRPVNITIMHRAVSVSSETGPMKLHVHVPCNMSFGLIFLSNSRNYF